MIKVKVSLIFLIILVALAVKSQCTMSVVPIAQFGGPGTYVNNPSGFLGPYQVCNNAVVYDTLGTSNRRYYLQGGTTLYLKNSFFHYVYMASNSTLVNLGGIGDVFVYKTINSTISGMITPPPATCAAVSFPTLACNAPTVTGMESKENDLNFDLFPNPVSQVLHIQKGNNKECNFTLSNTLGAVIQFGSIVEQHSKLNVAVLPEGLYFLELSQEDQVIRKRIYISR